MLLLVFLVQEPFVQLTFYFSPILSIRALRLKTIHRSLNALFLKRQKAVHQRALVVNFKEFDRETAKKNLTPIPYTYTSSPLDGMARSYIIIFSFRDTLDYAIYRVWIHFIPTSLFPRREKTFGLSWNRTQVLLLHKRPL